MIHTIGVTVENELVFNFPLSDIFSRLFEWYWIDFDEPDESEEALLHSFFHFPPLGTEDCLTCFQQF